VIFINFYPCFLNEGFNKAYEKLGRRLQKRIDKASERWQHRPEMYTYEEEPLLRAHAASLPRVSMQDAIRHIEYAVKIAGIEGVGIGSDYDGTPFMPAGMEDCTSLPRLCDALRKRKFRPADIDKIAGGNFLRVFGDVVG
jgi:membrane dipeptidase